MDDSQNFKIQTPREKKEKLIQWYGWITIIILCLTPLVFILLPLLMMNTSKINTMLKESRIPQKAALKGVVKKASWEFNDQYGIYTILGNLEIKISQGELISCTFKKYVGKKSRALPYVSAGDNLILTGVFNDLNMFSIRNMRKVDINYTYTSEPILSVY